MYEKQEKHGQNTSHVSTWFIKIDFFAYIYIYATCSILRLTSHFAAMYVEASTYT